jgi:mannose-6-phosphate isomerase-like protein (cupin superfamily)
MLLPPGASIGSHMHRGVAEFYYVMSGEGAVSMSNRGQAETAPIRTGDAIPIQLGEMHSFENTGTAPLEFMVVGVARDAHNKEVDTLDSAPGGGRRGGNQ